MCPPALPGPLCGPFCSAHRGDLPSAAVLASRLITRLSLTHIPFMAWSLLGTSRTVCEVTQFLVHKEPTVFSRESLWAALAIVSLMCLELVMEGSQFGCLE